MSRPQRIDSAEELGVAVAERDVATRFLVGNGAGGRRLRRRATPLVARGDGVDPLGAPLVRTGRERPVVQRLLVFANEQDDVGRLLDRGDFAVELAPRARLGLEAARRPGR